MIEVEGLCNVNTHNTNAKCFWETEREGVGENSGELPFQGIDGLIVSPQGQPCESFLGAPLFLPEPLGFPWLAITVRFVHTFSG